MKGLTTTVAIILGAAAAGIARAADPTPTITALDDLPKSTDASAYLSEAYSAYGGVPPQVTGAVATSLASELYSLELSWASHSMASSDNFAIWSAAAKATDGSAVWESLSTSGYNYGQITTNAWYSEHVPDDVKSDIAGYNSAWQSAFNKVVVATTTSGNAAGVAGVHQAKCTGMAMAVAAGVAGVVVAM
ncbi:hypothetical protein B0H66DRAFT_535186 [Apodospora peruviana]|uniref:Uncharacterized protein n=1 Tax=Apodospora peruviana TaxID=516989 RepID=A0AAE0I1N7_9PEZI|nr:hypothetical protein B0H66DRAFT_535186 [Apodospora peruviana]